VIQLQSTLVLGDKLRKVGCTEGHAQGGKSRQCASDQDTSEQGSHEHLDQTAVPYFSYMLHEAFTPSLCGMLSS
jgi:hypothetical protein